MKKIHKPHYRWAKIVGPKVPTINAETVLKVLTRVMEPSPFGHASDMRINIVLETGAILSGYVFYANGGMNEDRSNGFAIYSNRNAQVINETNSTLIPIYNILAIEWANKKQHWVDKSIREYSTNKPLCPTISDIEKPFIKTFKRYAA